MKIHVFYEGSIGLDGKDRYQTLANLCESLSGKQPGVVNLVFADAARIRELNRTYRGKDTATDVLSFPSGMGGELFGEIYICFLEAKLHARRLGISYQRRLDKLFTHGLFHIYGYNHEKDEDYRVMKLLESKVLKRFYGLAKGRVQN